MPKKQVTVYFNEIADFVEKNWNLDYRTFQRLCEDTVLYKRKLPSNFEERDFYNWGLYDLEQPYEEMSDDSKIYYFLHKFMKENNLEEMLVLND